MYTDVWNMFDFITSICFDSQVQSTVISHQHHWHSPISDACISSMTPAQAFLTGKSILSLYLMISSFAHYLAGHSQWPRQDLRGPERCGPCGLSWTQLPLCLPLHSHLAPVILKSCFLGNHSYLKASNMMPPLPLTSVLHIQVIFLSQLTELIFQEACRDPPEWAINPSCMCDQQSWISTRVSQFPAHQLAVSPRSLKAP